jgi:hypothetical protein
MEAADNLVRDVALSGGANHLGAPEVSQGAEPGISTPPLALDCGILDLVLGIWNRSAAQGSWPLVIVAALSLLGSIVRCRSAPGQVSQRMLWGTAGMVGMVLALVLGLPYWM